jgi:hypothetical protein
MHRSLRQVSLRQVEALGKSLYNTSYHDREREGLCHRSRPQKELLEIALLPSCVTRSSCPLAAVPTKGLMRHAATRVLIEFEA